MQYARLLDIGRKVVDRQVQRPLRQRVARTALAGLLPRRWIFSPAMKAGQALRPLLPAVLRQKVTQRAAPTAWPARTHARRMLVLDGCVQPAMAPNINAATARVLDTLGVQLLAAPKAGCCGALRHHLDEQEAALADVRRNIDAWWPYIEGRDGGGAPVEAILMTASGCGVMVKDYGHLLAQDPAYAEKAARISALTLDLSEVMARFEPELQARLAGQARAPDAKRVAYHPPCTLQHGQKIRGHVERLLGLAGVDVKLCQDSHLCCGSAGTYSVLQPELSTQLRDRKIASLEATGAQEIVSANIGCQSHLQGGTALPVRHWIELIDNALAARPAAA